MSFIEIKKMNKYYPVGKDKFHALKDIDLTVEAGEVLAVMGKSGSGKSTLLNIIGTIDDYASGSYLYKGRDISKMSDKDKAALRSSEIGFVNQEFLLLNQKTAIENVSMPLYFNETRYRDIESHSLAALEAVGVADQAKKKITDMSGGQKQRVAIARALVIEPSLILADEPTGALDRKTADEIIETLLKLNRERGITVVIITHDAEVAAACGRVVNIVDGEIR